MAWEVWAGSRRTGSAAVQKTGFGAAFPQEGGDGRGWNPAAEHLSRVGLRALNSSLGITESSAAGGGGEVVQ